MPTIPVTPPHVSINRIRLVDLPGLPIDDDVRGQRADYLLSSHAVIRYARQQAEALRLPPEFTIDSLTTRLNLPRYINNCLHSDDPIIRKTATAIGDRLGRNLGHILLTLHRGDDINQAARIDWTAAEWQCWQNISRIWLGGGLMQSELGDLIYHQAKQWLIEMGYPDSLTIKLTPYRQDMALLGAARYLPLRDGVALGFDFGHTLVKRGRLRFEEGHWVDYQPYPAVLVPWDVHTGTVVLDEKLGQQVKQFVVDTISETIAMASTESLAPHLMLCMAAYVAEGQLLGNGLYATMSRLTRDVRPMLTEAIQERTRAFFQVYTIHDGTAASTLHAGEKDSAVIAVGTALGVGFPPESAAGLVSIRGKRPQTNP